VIDHDNLAASFKCIADALVKWGVLHDDAPEFIGRPEYLHAKAPPKQGRVEILVEEIA
jgi:Holliday junction resolvase RusA-like endonuclease